MEKAKTKKAVSQKKTKAVANKKNQKTDKMVKTDKKVKTDYPSWTSPEHLSKSDHKSLKRFYDLYVSGKIISAFSFASNFDTIVRDAIPSDIWEKQYGKLTKKTVEDTEKSVEEKAETEEIQEKQDLPKETKSSLPNAFILKDNLLEPAFVENPSVLIEKKFKSKNELEQLVLTNGKTLFGQQILIIENKETPSEFLPDRFLFDFNDAEKPRLYLLETALSIQNFGNIYARITHFIASLKNKNRQNDFLAKLCDFASTKEQKKKLQTFCKDKEISEFISEMLGNRPAIMLIMDDNKSDLLLMRETYADTWGKMVKLIVIKKHSIDKDAIYTMSPIFADIFKGEKYKKEEIIKSTEDDHLNAVPVVFRNIYNEIKTALLNADNTIEFNPKKFYISLRKNKNIAFFQLRKKSLSIVVVNPKDETRKVIKHHVIKTLPESVQKFWNGPSCTLIIENADNLNEVISLLTKMITKS